MKFIGIGCKSLVVVVVGHLCILTVIGLGRWLDVFSIALIVWIALFRLVQFCVGGFCWLFGVFLLGLHLIYLSDDKRVMKNIRFFIINFS